MSERSEPASPDLAKGIAAAALGDVVGDSVRRRARERGRIMQRLASPPRPDWQKTV